MSRPADYLSALTELAGVVLAHPNLDDALVAICQIAVEAVPGAEAASLTTERAGAPVATASDDWSRSLDETQFREHEGPCLDAMRAGNVFRVEDLETERRWPAYAPLAAKEGARSVLSVPTSADGRVIGALNVYAREPRAFDAEAASIVQVVAAHAGLAAQVSSAFYGHRDLADQMREAMQSRAVIEQAKGMLMLRDHCDAEAAFQTLVRTSQRSNTRLRDVARMVIDWGTASGAGGDKPPAPLA